MNSVFEARILDYLRQELKCEYYDTGTILECMRSQARMAGHELDERFAFAGLGAGPEARVASRIATRAMCGGAGFETADYAMSKEIAYWLIKHPRVGQL